MILIFSIVNLFFFFVSAHYCKNKTFGWKCMHSCNCKNNEKCNSVTGACRNGCREGFYGINCLLRKFRFFFFFFFFFLINFFSDTVCCIIFTYFLSSNSPTEISLTHSYLYPSIKVVQPYNSTNMAIA